jgi:uncharacterized protein YjbI with pentapeptide repeats
MQRRAEDELELLHGAVATASRLSQQTLLTFLAFGIYAVIAIYSTTDEQILRESPAALPLLRIKVPLGGFYILMPLLLVVLHFNLLFQLNFLAQRLRALDRAIRSGASLEARIEVDRDHHRKLLYPFLLNNILMGKGVERPLLRLVLWVSVIAFPIFVLLSAQLVFVRYHSFPITLWHRLLVLADLLLLAWIFWPAVVEPETTDEDLSLAQGIKFLPTRRKFRRGPWLARARIVATAVLSAVTFLVSLCGIVVPDDLFGYNNPLARWTREAFRGSLTVRGATLTRDGPARQLILADVLREKQSVRASWRQRIKGLDLRGRDLRNADLSDAVLTNGNLTGALLQGANFEGADLDGAQLAGARLDGADLSGTHLEGANLRGATLTGASLSDAHLEGAVLKHAVLLGADLRRADLSAADIRSADLRLAHLERSRAHAANFSDSDLRGARMEKADLAAANLRWTRLLDARMIGTNIYLADLRGASARELSDEDWHSLLEDLSRIPRARRRFQRAAEALGTAAENFVRVQDVTGTDGALYDAGEVFWIWGTPQGEGRYRSRLADFVTTLACGRDPSGLMPPLDIAVTPIARGIARRARVESDRCLAVRVHAEILHGCLDRTVLPGRFFSFVGSVFSRSGLEQSVDPCLEAETCRCSQARGIGTDVAILNPVRRLGG